MICAIFVYFLGFVKEYKNRTSSYYRERIQSWWKPIFMSKADETMHPACEYVVRSDLNSHWLQWFQRRMSERKGTFKVEFLKKIESDVQEKWDSLKIFEELRLSFCCFFSLSLFNCSSFPFSLLKSRFNF